MLNENLDQSMELLDEMCSNQFKYAKARILLKKQSSVSTSSFDPITMLTNKVVALIKRLQAQNIQNVLVISLYSLRGEQGEFESEAMEYSIPVEQVNHR